MSEIQTAMAGKTKEEIVERTVTGDLQKEEFQAEKILQAEKFVQSLFIESYMDVVMHKEKEKIREEIMQTVLKGDVPIWGYMKLSLIEPVKNFYGKKGKERTIEEIRIDLHSSVPATELLAEPLYSEPFKYTQPTAVVANIFEKTYEEIRNSKFCDRFSTKIGYISVEKFIELNIEVEARITNCSFSQDSTVELGHARRILFPEGEKMTKTARCEAVAKDHILRCS